MNIDEKLLSYVQEYYGMLGINDSNRYFGIAKITINKCIKT